MKCSCACHVEKGFFQFSIFIDLAIFVSVFFVSMRVSVRVDAARHKHYLLKSTGKNLKEMAI